MISDIYDFMQININYRNYNLGGVVLCNPRVWRDNPLE